MSGTPPIAPDIFDPKEPFMPPKKAVEFLASSIGRKYHPITITRWGRHGVNGVKLKTIRVGSSTMVTRAALVEFIEALSAKGS